MANKYKNIKSGVYSSKKEAKRGAELRLLEKAGEIQQLYEQVRVQLIPAQYIDGKCVERGCQYVADFTYYKKLPNGQKEKVVEDVKGLRTQSYIIKRKLMLWVHNIRVIEV